MGMFAQSLGEYGGLGSFGSTIQTALYSAGAWIRELSPMNWAVIAIVLVGLFVFLRR